VEVIPETCRAR